MVGVLWYDEWRHFWLGGVDFYEIEGSVNELVGFFFMMGGDLAYSIGLKDSFRLVF